LEIMAHPVDGEGEAPAELRIMPRSKSHQPVLYNMVVVFTEGTSMSATLTVRCRENGPLVIPLDQGVTIQLTDHLGNAFAIPEGKTTIAICRCGQSSRKPFCDGTHKNCGFLASETAVPAPVTT
jgi:CDGSH-type Zn-finger protein